MDISLYFEYSLISGLLNHPEYFCEVGAKLRPEYFQKEINQALFDTMLDMPNFTTTDLIKNLAPKFSYKEIVMIDAFTPLAKREDVVACAEIVFELYKEREIRRLALEISESGEDKVLELTDRMNAVKSLQFEEETVDTQKVFAEKIERIYRGEKDLRNYPTGLTALDYKIEGLKKGELIILGGRPGSGKTTLATNIAFNIAKSRNNVLFFSLEMGAVELHERLVSAITELKPYPNMPVYQIERIFEVSHKVEKELPLKINDKAGLTVEELFLECKKAKQAGKLDVVVIDHMSILKSRKTFKSRYEEISEISRLLKVLAKDFDVPVLCLCQLNRALEGREVKAPTMADLRDSGSIEQDADLVLFVYRPEYHLLQRKPDNDNTPKFCQWQGEVEAVRGKAYCVIAKNRRGETGQVEMIFDGKHSKFKEAA